MSKVYVRLCEPELRKILESLDQSQQPGAKDLVCKIELLLTQMQPGSGLTLEAPARR